MAGFQYATSSHYAWLGLEVFCPAFPKVIVKKADYGFIESGQFIRLTLDAISVSGTAESIKKAVLENTHLQNVTGNIGFVMKERRNSVFAKELSKAHANASLALCLHNFQTPENHASRHFKGLLKARPNAGSDSSGKAKHPYNRIERPNCRRGF